MPKCHTLSGEHAMKYSPGLMVGELSRSVGNTTASHNRYGPYFRSRVIPVNPDTNPQRQSRDNLALNSAAWRSLTALQRSGWESLAAQVTLYDTLGNPYHPTGHQLFVSLNNNLRNISFATISDPPALLTTPPLTSVTPTAAGGGAPSLSIAFVPTPVPASTTFVFELTGPQSAGKSFVPRSLFRKVQTYAAAGASPLNALANYQGIFGNPVTGQRIFWKARAVSTVTGFASQPLQGFITAT